MILIDIFIIRFTFTHTHTHPLSLTLSLCACACICTCTFISFSESIFEYLSFCCILFNNNFIYLYKLDNDGRGLRKGAKSIYGKLKTTLYLYICSSYLGYLGSGSGIWWRNGT